MNALQSHSLSHELKYKSYKSRFEESLEGDTSSLLKQSR